MAIPIALQLYSVRDDCARDLRGTLRAVADMGYEAVEFAGWHGHSVDDLKSMLHETGLTCCGSHTPIEHIRGEELRRVIHFNQSLNNLNIVIPYVGLDYRGSKENFQRLVDELAAAAETAQDYNAFIGYHNHDFEFKALEDGTIPMRYIFQNTPENVTMQLDTGNALHGGMSATPLIEEFAGRSKTIHLKEHSDTNPDALVGEGDVDWPNVFKSCESVGGTEFYIVEVEQYPLPPLECAKRSLENLRAMGK